MTDTKSKTVAEELRDAAKTLRETAAKATRGPWIAHPTMGFSGEDTCTWTVGLPYCDKGAPDTCEPGCAGDVVTTGREGCEEDHLGEADAAWIALANPLLAEPLAALLDHFAGKFERLGGMFDRTVSGPSDRLAAGGPELAVDFALAVARAVNGISPEVSVR